MKKLLLILLCAPLIGVGQSVNKDTIIKNLHNVIDSLEYEISDLEEFLQSYTNNWCCQSGIFPGDSITYWENGNKKELKISHNDGTRDKPYREWYKNGKIKRIYVYGDCEVYHKLSGIICFDRNTREIDCE